MIGGTPDTQKEFLEILTSDTSKRPQDRQKRKPLVANEFALGYTYQDVLDTDQEGEELCLLRPVSNLGAQLTSPRHAC